MMFFSVFSLWQKKDENRNFEGAPSMDESPIDGSQAKGKAEERRVLALLLRFQVC